MLLLWGAFHMIGCFHNSNVKALPFSATSSNQLYTHTYTCAHTHIDRCMSSSRVQFKTCRAAKPLLRILSKKLNSPSGNHSCEEVDKTAASIECIHNNVGKLKAILFTSGTFPSMDLDIELERSCIKLKSHCSMPIYRIDILLSLVQQRELWSCCSLHAMIYNL
jgi:hypothetical protein